MNIQIFKTKSKPIKISKLSNRILFRAFIAIILFITTFSVFALSSIKFRSLAADLHGSEENIIGDRKGIKHLEVSASNVFSINQSGSVSSNYTPIFEAKDIQMVRMGDTLKIFNKTLDPRTLKTYSICSIDLPNLQSIKVFNNSAVSIYHLKNTNMEIEAADDGSVYVNPQTKCEFVKVRATGVSFVSLLKNIKNIYLDINGDAEVYIKSDGAVVEGVMRNRSFVDIVGNYIQMDKVVKKDSSAIIYLK